MLMTKQSIVMFSSKVIKLINQAKSIAVIGNGGNLAIAKHAASDMSRHLGKFCFAPESVHMSALGGDSPWHTPWIEHYARNAQVMIGITTRLDSPIANALANKPDAILFAPKQHPTIETVVIDKKTFHEFEVETLWQFYMLMERCGAVLPTIDP